MPRARAGATRTAPELFEADDIGNGHEIGDGTVSEALEHQARVGRRQLPPSRPITIEEAN